MNRLIAKFVLVLFMIGCVAPVQAKEWNLKDWLKELQSKVMRTEKRHKKRVVAAAAVRGSKKKKASSQKLYWKGKKTKKPVTQEELDAFKKVLALIEDEKTDKAAESLEAFIEKNPESALLADAEQTLALLKPSPEDKESESSEKKKKQ